MPDHPLDPKDMDRFHEAVDRLANGVPAPSIDDPDLQELLDLAGRLRRELPWGLPDPVFTDSLKRELLQPHTPAIVAHPRRASRAERRIARFPYAAAIGAIAAVLVAAIAVGAVALMTSGDDGDSPGVADIAQPENETAGMSTFSIDASSTTDSSVVDAEPTGGSGGTRAATDPSGVTGTPTVAAPAATLTGGSGAPSATAQPTAEPTSDRQLAMALPAVNSTTVESGPVPMADPGAGGAVTTITYVLATSLPALPSSAPAYLLAPPDQDPVVLVEQIARQLGLEGEVQASEDRGRMDYHIGTDDGATFHWYPETGVFIYSGVEDDPGSSMSSDEVIARCRGWLSAVGYPVDHLTDAMQANPVDNTSWLVETPMEAMPQPGFGHPLGVTMLVNSEGQVIDARGYWLTTESMELVDLITAEEAWLALQSHEGYWFGSGGAFMDGGELRVESMELSYVLTSSPDGLVLQPVIAIRGEFAHADGLASSGVTVFIRAARSELRQGEP